MRMVKIGRNWLPGSNLETCFFYEEGNKHDRNAIGVYCEHIELRNGRNCY